MVTTRLSNVDRFQESSTAKRMVGNRLLTSHRANWQNIALEHWWRPAQEIPVYSAQQHAVAIQLSNKGSTERKLAGVFKQETNQIGDVVLVPANVEHWAKFKQDAEVLIISLIPEELAITAHEAIGSDRVELIPQFAHADPTLEQIGRALLAELQSDYYGCKLYAESLANAMFAHLIRKYSTSQLQIKEYQDGLSRYRLKKTLGYIHNHLDRELKLSEIAKEINMSQYYFCRLFRKSMGISPYQYIIQQRVEKAKRLLRANYNLSIADIALECGFSHQSHLNKYFRQYTQSTPNDYRKQYHSA
ncbi:MAG: AraC family transcriptional regulator [Pleurocapsa sp. MO_226.B13]|nr:AraC family transcriptional regulator [Pleurocapsa sp. MO_226.B13]